MINYFLTPPIIYYLILFIIILSILVYWKRKWLKKELHRWHLKEIGVGAVKFGIEKDNKVSKKTGVYFGKESNFSKAKIKGVAGRDIVRGQNSPASKGDSPGVTFEKGDYQDTEFEDIAGRDIVNNQTINKKD